MAVPWQVGVQLESRDGLFFEGSRLVRPNLRQLDVVLIELDVPDHDGQLHFLEVLLALLQRLTGVVNEETIMAKLLHTYPKYLASVKHMPYATREPSPLHPHPELAALVPP